MIDLWPKPDWECDGVRLYCGDCLEILPTLPAGSIDAVVTDPPYGIEIEPKYFEIAVKRIDQEQRQGRMAFA